MREVTVGGAPNKQYVHNGIKTSKYTWYTFIPKNLFEQMHKFGNVYFLILSAMMYLGEHTTLFIGTIASFSTFGTLCMMMSVTAAVALIDDRRRGKADQETNSQEATYVVIGQEGTAKKRWDEVKVGDVLYVQDGEEFSADLVPLVCSGDEGSCYVSTANLDGETNLKLKGAPDSSSKKFGDVQRIRSEEDLKRARTKILQKLKTYQAKIMAEAPRASIHDFQGSIGIDGASNGDSEALESKHLLLRGTVLRNTAFCVGVVVYTGAETRMVMNSRPAPLKLSNLEKITNATMLVVLVAQALLALVSDFSYMATQSSYMKAWYLSPPDLLLPDALGYWLTFFVLYSNMMPISLYPTMEWCNYWQTYFIRNDKQMYYVPTSMPAGVRASNLCQELGQVSYIFSDKTGTLTQNVMELKRVFIGGSFYGQMGTHRGFDGGQQMFQDCQDQSKKKKIDAFLEVLAVAHTVMVSDGEGGMPKYEAESPDESALVEATGEVGWRLRDRVRNQVMVDVNTNSNRGTNTGDKAESRTYTVHAVNAFDSTRKRQSVVVEFKGEFSLLVKGADNVMLDRADKGQDNLMMQNALQEFAEQGLRTLVIGRRSLKKEEFVEWKKTFDNAARSLGDRAAELAKVAEEIEVNLDLAGATAIEDKLQDGVPETIVNLRKAGINLWVLTGDKLETARNIGFSSKVLDNGMTISALDKPPEADGNSMRQALDQAEAELVRRQFPRDKAMMVTGPALEHIFLDESLKQRFLALAVTCSIVIACRVSPLQKAQMVRLVRDSVKPTPVTLSVGDGANDVPMIQEAQVGVGIAGREGRQAVNNSDFSIGQFRYLQRLLLVHGRWNYRRACKFTLFTFWRNAVQVLCIFYYTFASGFSGTCLFEDWLRLSFNFLCSFPIMATGCFDQDVPDVIALQHPDLYEVGRKGLDLNPARMGRVLVSALTHSFIILCVAGLSFGSIDLLGAGDYYTFGTTVFTLLLVDINCRVAMVNHTHNEWTLGTIFMSFALYAVFLLMYPCNKQLADILAPNMYMTPYKMVSTPTFWLMCLAVATVSYTVDATVLMTGRTFFRRLGLLAELRDKIGDTLTGSIIIPATEKDTENSAEDYKGIVITKFSQQQKQGVFFRSTLAVIRTISVVLGLILCVAGYIALKQSHNVKQIQVLYDGPGQSYVPWGTHMKDDIVDARELCENQEECRIELMVKHVMKPPLLVYYTVGPFYQNYNDYLTSEVPEEMMGKHVTEQMRESLCRTEAVRKRDGLDIVPCGIMATSMFNDTFKFSPHTVNVRDSYDESYTVAWPSDIDRYANQPGYPYANQADDPDRDKKWLPDLYGEGIINKEKGVKDPRFVEWMRPDATPYMRKRYGWIDHPLEKGTIYLTVRNNFNVDSFDGYKGLVVTELRSLGARNDGLGYALLTGGVFVIVLNIAMLCLQAKRYADKQEAMCPPLLGS